MDAAIKPEQSKVPGKKEMRQLLADKVTAAIPEMLITLGEKKFHHRVKKAVKLLTEGLHKKEAVKAVKSVKAVKAVKAKAPKKVAAKKARAAKKSDS